MGDGAPNTTPAAIVGAAVQGIQQGSGGALVEAMQGVCDEIKSSLAAPNPGLVSFFVLILLFNARGLTNPDHVAAEPLDVVVPQKVQYKIWARQYVDLTALLLEDEQEMELQICNEADKASFRMVPKHK